MALITPNVKRVSETIVFDIHVAQQRLSAKWSTRPALLYFVRHFGCPFCKEGVAKLREFINEFKRLDTEIIIIGNGSPNQAKAFQERYAHDLPVFVDQTRESYEAAGFKRSAWSTFGPKVFLAGLRALVKGYLPASVQGDVLQQGGALVVVPPDGMAIFHYANQHSGDHPPLREIVTAIEAWRKTVPDLNKTTLGGRLPVPTPTAPPESK